MVANAAKKTRTKGGSKVVAAPTSAANLKKRKSGPEDGMMVADPDGREKDSVTLDQPNRKKRREKTPGMSAMSAMLCYKAHSVSVDASDASEAEESVELTAYVYIEKPVVPRTGKSKIPESVQKGPFKFYSNDTYMRFLIKISTVLPWPFENILQDKITGKCQTPESSMPLPLATW